MAVSSLDFSLPTLYLTQSTAEASTYNWQHTDKKAQGNHIPLEKGSKKWSNNRKSF